jgi:hypothetical protein
MIRHVLSEIATPAAFELYDITSMQAKKSGEQKPTSPLPIQPSSDLLKIFMPF